MRSRILVRAALLAILGLVPWTATAEPMQDVDYVLIDPPVPQPGGKFEVIEFFHYGCAACYRLEPLLAAWLGRLPSDVAFRQLPALRRTDWVPLTRLFFALERAGYLPRLHGQVYVDVHEKGLNLGDSSEALDWALANGVDRETFRRTLESQQVTVDVQRARDATVAYGVRATPSMVVAGRYLTSAGMAGSVEALLPLVDDLIDMARAERRRP